MQRRQRNTAGALQRAELQAKALELRRAGLGFEAIADRIGVSKSQAHRYVVAGLESARGTIAAQADELRSEQLSRLDALLESTWFPARKGSLGALDRVLKILERRDKLLGLEAPTVSRLTLDGQLGHTVKSDLSGLSTDELRALHALLGKAKAKPAAENGGGGTPP